MLGLVYLSGGTLSRGKVATDPWYIFNRPRVVHFGWPPRPLRSVETDFAVDGTGFSSSVHRRWFDHKYGKMHSAAEYVKAHAMVGVRTNIVTSVEATPGNINDYPLLKPLLATTAKSFGIRRVSADKGYSGRSNVEAIAEAGAMPLIAFKANAKAGAPGPWRDSFEAFQVDQEGFYALYHQPVERRDDILHDQGQVRRLRAL